MVNQLFNLPQAGEEVSFSTEIWEGKSFLDKLATEANFRKFADNTDIIHLSSHSIINNDNPMFSKIVFSNDSNTSHDGLLHTYELYNMQLSARLVCLSACNTENGKIEKGEGVMSLARGFTHAGVQSY